MQRLLKFDNQLLVLIKRQVKTELMLDEKFRDLYEEVSNFVKEIEDVVKEVERLSCKDVAKETVCLLRRAQKHELAVAANSRGLFEGMLVYCDRENARDLEFADGLDNLWVELLEHTNERQLFITELEGLCPSAKRYKILECLNEDQKQDLIHLLEIRKVILRKYQQILGHVQHVIERTIFLIYHDWENTRGKKRVKVAPLVLRLVFDTWTLKSLCCTREINADLQFAVGLSQLSDVLYNRVNEIKMLSSELNLFGGPLAVQCAEYLKRLSKSEVLRMLELRKTIAESHI
nr:hypothetical protein [Tanacetum cinerariifolium]